MMRNSQNRYDLPENPTELQLAYRHYIDGKITYSQYKAVLERASSKADNVLTYSTGTPPPDYAPSPEPEPLRWNV